jgi:molecular chaperone GrpE
MTGKTTDPRDKDENGAAAEGAENAPAAGSEPAASDPQDQAADAAETPKSDADDLLTLAKENAELRDRLLRTMAEMENVRRRAEREKGETAKYAISNFARDVLTVGDNLHRVIEHVPGEAAANDPALKSFLDGVELTERELINMLERHGVSRLDPLGARFDPNYHQAMYEVANTDVPDGTVVDVMQAGYAIGDRCLRPALVAIAKGGAKQAAEAKATENEPEANQSGGDGKAEDGKRRNG